MFRGGETPVTPMIAHKETTVTQHSTDDPKFVATVPEASPESAQEPPFARENQTPQATPSTTTPAPSNKAARIPRRRERGPWLVQS